MIVETGAFEQFGIHRMWDYINLKYVDDINRNEDEIIRKIEKSTNTINEKLSFEPGINGFQFTNYSTCVTEGKVNVYSKRLTVTGNIDPHIFNNKTTRYKKKDYKEPYITYNSEIISEGKWKLFSSPKVMVAGMTKEIEAALDINGSYAPAVSVYSICGTIDNLYTIQTIINSKMINWFFKYKFSDKHMAGGYISVNNLLLQQIPFKKTQNSQLTKELAIKSNEFRVAFEKIVSNVAHFLISRNSLLPLSKKLKNWNELEFAEFLKELEKARKKSAKENQQEYKKLSLSEEAEWMQYFNEQKQKAQELKTQINQTDKEIDKMVYELYELTPEEIEIVENSVK